MKTSTKSQSGKSAPTKTTTTTRPRTGGRSAVKAYLEILSTPLPRGRQVNLAALRAKLASTSDHVERLRLVQKIHDAEHRVSSTDRAKLEEAFIAVAAEWGSANKITWAAWRELGVSADVLRRAKITR